MIRPEEFISEYIATPYVVDGRDLSGADCWGIVVLWYRHVLGEELPDWTHADKTRSWVVRLMTSEMGSQMAWLDAPRDHAIAVAQRGDLSHHVGIFYHHGIFHIPEGGHASFRPVKIAEAEFGNSIKYGVPKWML
jgi:cell wall-associated NlpC family hydrolase